jgi:hypothetical protein
VYYKLPGRKFGHVMSCQSPPPPILLFTSYFVPTRSTPSVFRKKQNQTIKFRLPGKIWGQLKRVHMRQVGAYLGAPRLKLQAIWSCADIQLSVLASLGTSLGIFASPTINNANQHWCILLSRTHYCIRCSGASTARSCIIMLDPAFYPSLRY